MFIFVSRQQGTREKKTNNNFNTYNPLILEIYQTRKIELSPLNRLAQGWPRKRQTLEYKIK